MNRKMHQLCTFSSSSITQHQHAVKTKNKNKNIGKRNMTSILTHTKVYRHYIKLKLKQGKHNYGFQN